VNGHIEIDFFSDSKIKMFVLNKQEWEEMKDDLSKVCLTNELKLSQMVNEMNLSVLSSSFTYIDRMYLILSKCNCSLNQTVSKFVFKKYIFLISIYRILV
jgi:hypothetical protein